MTIGVDAVGHSTVVIAVRHYLVELARRVCVSIIVHLECEQGNVKLDAGGDILRFHNTIAGVRTVLGTIIVVVRETK